MTETGTFPDRDGAADGGAVRVGARLALVLFATLLLWPAVLVDTDAEPMTDSVLLAAIRLVDRHTWTLSDEADPRAVSLTAAFDIAVHDGRVYSGVGVGASVIAAPVYALFKPAFDRFDERAIPQGRIRRYYLRGSELLGRPPATHWTAVFLLQIVLVWLVVAPLFAALLVRLHRALLDAGRPRTQSLVVALSVGFGTMLLYYSSTYSRQGLASLLAWHGILCLVRPRGPSARGAIVAGLLLGAAVSVEYAVGILVVIALAFCLPRLTTRQRLLVLAPVAAVGALVGLYHWAAFGSPFETPYLHRYWATFESDMPGGMDFAHFDRGRYGGISLPSAAVMWRLCFGGDKGLFVYSPVLLLGLLGHLRGLRTGPRRLHLFCLVTFAVYLVFNSAMGSHLAPDQAQLIWGGMNLWGPRHLMPTVALLAVGLGALDWSRTGWRAACVATLPLSCALNVLAASFGHRLTETSAGAADAGLPPRRVLDLAQELGPRVTLMDAYGVSPTTQWLVFGLLVAGTCVSAWVATRDE